MDPPLWINVIKLLPWLKKLNKSVAPNKWIKQEGHSNYKADIQPHFMGKGQKMINLYYFFMFYCSQRVQEVFIMSQKKALIAVNLAQWEGVTSK